MEKDNKMLVIKIPFIAKGGQTMETAIQISGVHRNYLIDIQKRIIKYIFDNEPWTKVGQSLIFTKDNVYDKIEVVKLVLDNGDTEKYEFWFDITGCYE